MNAEQAKTLTREDSHRHAAALRPETPMLIDGKLVDAQSGKKFETVNPANRAVIAAVPLGDAAEINLAVAAGRRACKSGIWSRLEPRSRMEVLYRFAAAINEHALEFALLDAIDVGKPVMNMIIGDVPAAALTFQYFAETINKIEGTVTTTSAADAFHYILRHLRHRRHGRQSIGAAYGCRQDQLHRLDRGRQTYDGLFRPVQSEARHRGDRRKIAADHRCRGPGPRPGGRLRDHRDLCQQGRDVQRRVAAVGAKRDP